MEKLINVEKEWVCIEVMGPCCLISDEEVAAAIKGIQQLGKNPQPTENHRPTGVLSKMMKESGVFWYKVDIVSSSVYVLLPQHQTLTIWTLSKHN